jgi:hypothetical protein
MAQQPHTQGAAYPGPMPPTESNAEELAPQSCSVDSGFPADAAPEETQKDCDADIAEAARQSQEPSTSQSVETSQQGVIHVQISTVVGASIAELTMPRSTAVLKLRQLLAERDEMQPHVSLLHLLLDGHLLSDCMTLGDLAPQELEAKLALQLVKTQGGGVSQSHEFHGCCWEVHTKKRGWAPLAPALQPALDAAMASNEERVELLIDTVARSWVPNPAAVDDTTRQRCVVYVALPRERKMGKVGGEPPRPIRRQASASGVEDEVGDQADTLPMDEDPLMFTAKPVDGVVLRNSIFDRLQQDVVKRYAGHRYFSAFDQYHVEEA